MELPILLVTIPLAGLGAPADDPPGAAADVLEIEEWEVPWEATRPRDPYVAPDGRVWFVGQRADYIGILDPDTGEFERFELPEGTGPHNVIVDDAGYGWYAGNRAAHIGRLDAASGDIVQYPMPDPDAVRDPHTLIFDGRGGIWFTAQGSNVVGRLDMSTGDLRVVPMTIERSRPYGIVVDETGRPWFNLLGTNMLGTIDPATFELTEIELPRAEARTRRIGITGDGGVWYVDWGAGYVGRYDPVSGEVAEWAAPAAADSRPYAMAIDDRDRIWFVETGVAPNRFVGFDPATEEFIAITEVPSGGGTVRHMVFHEPTRTIWFGTDTNTIGRARLP